MTFASTQCSVAAGDGAAGRAFGFALTFYPGVIALLLLAATLVGALPRA